MGHATEQMHKVAGPKAGSQVGPQRYLQNLDESLYRVVVWGLVKALLTTSPGRASLSPKRSVQEGKVGQAASMGESC